MPYQKDWVFMKLRKSLVAAATALTVATAGTTVALAETPAPEVTAEDQKEQVVTAEPTDGDKDKDTNGDADKGKEGEKGEEPKDGSSKAFGSSIKDQQPEDIKAWISVFTAIITALAAVFAFTQKYLQP